MKWFCSFVAAGTVLAALAMTPANAAETWKLASALATGDRGDEAVLKFIELVNKGLNGRATIANFNSSQLGSERELTEGVKLGTIEFGMTSTSAMTSFVPQLQFYDLPFLFRDLAHARKVATGPVGDKLLKAMENAGIKGLATAESGFRDLLTVKVPVRQPSDMVGLKFRVLESAPHIATFKAIGAGAVPLPFGETYGALQQGVVDGLDMPLGNISAPKLYEVVSYLSFTEHLYTPHVFIMNLDLFNSLKPEEQKVILDAAKVAADLERQRNDELVPKWIAELQGKGMKMIEISDKGAFRDKMKPVWAQFEGRIGKDLIEATLSTP